MVVQTDWRATTSLFIAVQKADALMIENRNQIERYLPLTDERAMLFVTEWEDFVLSCLRRMHLVDIEDVLYQVFYRALEALPGFHGNSKLSTWLYRIAWREGLRHIQKHRSIAQNETTLDTEMDVPDPEETVLEVLERQETAERVQCALSKLPVEDREILALRYLEELKIAEIAERLGMPVGTVKARVHRALAKFKLLLEEAHGE